METPPKTGIRAGGEGRDRPLRWRCRLEQEWDVGMGFSGASPAFHELRLPRFASDPIPGWIWLLCKGDSPPIPRWIWLCAPFLGCVPPPKVARLGMWGIWECWNPPDAGFFGDMWDIGTFASSKSGVLGNMRDMGMFASSKHGMFGNTRLKSGSWSDFSGKNMFPMDFPPVWTLPILSQALLGMR